MGLFNGGGGMGPRKQRDIRPINTLRVIATKQLPVVYTSFSAINYSASRSKTCIPDQRYVLPGGIRPA